MQHFCSFVSALHTGRGRRGMEGSGLVEGGVEGKKKYGCFPSNTWLFLGSQMKMICSLQRGETLVQLGWTSKQSYESRRWLVFTRQRVIPGNWNSFHLFVFISRLESFHHSQRANHVVSSVKSWAVWLHFLYFMCSTQVVTFCHRHASLPIGTTIWGIWMNYSQSRSSLRGDRRWRGRC